MGPDDQEKLQMLALAEHVPPAAYQAGELPLVDLQNTLPVPLSTPLLRVPEARAWLQGALPVFPDIAKFQPELLRSANRVPPGLSDEIYALLFRYYRDKTFDEWSEAVLSAAKGMKPDHTNIKKWFRNFVDNRHFKLQTLPNNEQYLERDGKPVLSNGMVPGALNLLHEIYGHTPKARLLNLVQDRFFIPHGAQTFVGNALDQHSCMECDLNAPLPPKQHKDSIRTFVAFERVQIDACEIATDALSRLREGHGFRYLLTVIDCFTKFAFAFPLKTLSAVEAVANLKVVFQFFVPDIIQSDNGRQFRNALVKALAAETGFKHLRGSPHTPEHQGQVERFNRTIKEAIFGWICKSKTPSDWHSYVAKEITRYNRTKHSTTGFPPEKLVFGRLRNPQDRATDDDEKLSLLAWARRDQRFTLRAGEELFNIQENITALQVIAHVEHKGELARAALNGIAKRNARNRFCVGDNVAANPLLTLGAEVIVPRPQKGIESKDPTQTKNIEGTVVAASLEANRYGVEIESDEGKGGTVWEPATRIIVASSGQPTAKKELNISWREIKIRAQEFIDFKIDADWRDTRALIKKIQSEAVVDDEREIDEALGRLELPNELEAAPNLINETIVIQVLDRLFMAHLIGQAGYETLKYDDLSPGHISLEETALLLRYVVKRKFQFFMAAAAQWRRSRTKHPEILLPLVIAGISGQIHKCSDCFFTSTCQSSHACCVTAAKRRVRELEQPTTEKGSIHPVQQEESPGISDESEDDVPLSKRVKKVTVVGTLLNLIL